MTDSGSRSYSGALAPWAGFLALGVAQAAHAAGRPETQTVHVEG